MLSQTLDYASIRGLQISFAFALTLLIQFFFRYPNADWTAFAVMMIYAGFDNGTTLFRAYHRFLGVLMGLASGYILAIIGRHDIHVLFILIVLVIFMAYFFAGKAYSVPTIFTVNTSIIGTGYFSNNETIYLLYYVIDYGVCTVIAFGLIWFLETCWFNRFHLMERFLFDVLKRVLSNLHRLMALLHEKNHNRNDWYLACGYTIHSIHRVHELLQNAAFCKYSESIAGDEITAFIQTAEICYTRLKALFYAHYTQNYMKYDFLELLKEVEFDVSKLGDTVSWLQSKIQKIDAQRYQIA